MKGLLLNALLGLILGRFGSVWWLLIFLPVVAAELAYGVYVHYLGLNVGFVRRGLALLVCGQIGFLIGALMRPLSGEIWRRHRLGAKRIRPAHARAEDLGRRQAGRRAGEPAEARRALPSGGGSMGSGGIAERSLGQKLFLRFGATAILVVVVFVVVGWIAFLGWAAMWLLGHA